MYFLSGLFFPLIIFFISNKHFLIYNFTKNNNSSNIRCLSIIVISNLILLSFLITKYFIAFIDLSLQLLNNYNFKFNINIEGIQINYIILFISVLLIFSKTKFLIKKITLVVFLIISTLVWLTSINLLGLDYTYFYSQTIYFKLIGIKNINIINILNLLFIEVAFYFWSYISQDNNLSNWNVLVPSYKNLYPLFYIFIFYIATIIYYSKLV